MASEDMESEISGRAMRRKPVQNRSRARVERLLKAALDLLEEGRPLSTTAIAQRAGSPVGSLYQYFPNLDALLRALAQRLVDQVRGEASAVFSSAGEETERANWEAAIRSLVDRSVAKFGGRTAYLRLLQELRFSTGFHDALGDLRRLTENDIRPWLRHNGLDDANAAWLGHVLFELLLTLQLCYGQTSGQEEKERVVSEFKRLIVVYLQDSFERKKAHM